MSSSELIEICQKKLLKKKTELLNRMTESCGELPKFVELSGGDEGDQSVRALKEREFLNMNERFQQQLKDIESALSRIETGSYGTCEETGEEIEPERLKAIPWTTCSIEGAEIRENKRKKYVQVRY